VSVVARAHTRAALGTQTQQADVMAETSKQRLQSIEEQLKTTRANYENIENLTVADIEAMHPEWKEKADQDIINHQWNLIEGIVFRCSIS
jgi:molecular chaperone GrpE (heat shock protein)